MPFSEADKAAALALLTLYVRAWDARKADVELQEQLSARLAEHASTFTKLKGAFSLFGIDTADADVWKKFREEIGDELYMRAVNEAKNSNGLVGPPKPSSKTETHSSSQTVTVREGVLAKLKADAEKGFKAADIRAFLASAYGMQLHEKTVGMTLYRLSQDGLARREGRTWFFVPQTAEMKNPAGDTAGFSEDLL
jgi:hypothetical protein